MVQPLRHHLQLFQIEEAILVGIKVLEVRANQSLHLVLAQFIAVLTPRQHLPGEPFRIPEAGPFSSGTSPVAITPAMQHVALFHLVTGLLPDAGVVEHRELDRLVLRPDFDIEQELTRIGVARGLHPGRRAGRLVDLYPLRNLTTDLRGMKTDKE